MDEEKYIEVGGRLHSIATGNIVANADEIADKGKKQSVINAETDAALEDRYTKEQTYSKSELNNMITTPNQKYVSVTATAQTTDVTDVLPATGEADTVYRIGNWDGSQFDASVYSEYAWNGSQYVHLSTKTQIGEVFDISAYHATGGTLATYADLSAALDSNNGGGVPQSLQKGGMSIKFVQSSDNKYVQYRLMSDTFSTTESDWQGVDDEPTVGSENLVKSGGVFYGDKKAEFPIFGENSTVATVTGVSYKNSIYTFIPAGTKFYVKILGESGLLSDDNLSVLRYYNANLETVNMRNPIPVPSEWNFTCEHDIYGLCIERPAEGVIGAGNITISVETEKFVVSNDFTRNTNLNKKINRFDNVLFVGDSIVKGYNGSTYIDNCWVNLFCKSVGCFYTNAAVAGSRFQGGGILAQLQAATLNNYSVIFITGGINDKHEGFSKDVIASAVKDVCDYLHNNYNGTVIWQTPQNDCDNRTTYDGAGINRKNSITVEELRNSIFNIVVSYGYGIVDGRYIPFPSRVGNFIDGVLSSDNVHPTELGHKLYAQYMLAAMGEVDADILNTIAYGFNWIKGNIDQNGRVSADSNYSNYYSELIKADGTKNLYVKSDRGYNIAIAYYSNGTFVSRSSFTSYQLPICLSSENDIRLIIARGSSSSDSLASMLTHYTFEDNKSNITGSVKKIADEVFGEIAFVQGYISSDGTFYGGANTNSVNTSYLKLKKDVANGMLIKADEGFAYRISSYNDDNSFRERGSIINGDGEAHTISTDYDIRIECMTVLSSSLTQDELLSHFSIGDLTYGLRVLCSLVIHRVAALKNQSENADEELQEQIDTINADLQDQTTIPDSQYLNNKFIRSNGNTDSSDSFKALILNIGDNVLRINVTCSFNGDAAYCFLDDAEGNHLLTFNNSTFTDYVFDMSQYPTAKTLKLSCRKNGTTEVLVSARNIVSKTEYVRDCALNDDKLNYIKNFINSDFAGSIFHFSFDDVCWCLYDLIQNANSYTSIFENDFFKCLKEVHDETGMVFTLNTFNTVGENASGYYPTGYDISSVPTKFQSEFQAAKGWLRFAFHGENENSNYSISTGILNAYNTFVAAIYKLTGDYDCIDRVTRLGFFGGTLENVKQIKDADYGIVGLYGADDARAYDYYLSSDEYNTLRRKGKYIDLNNQMLFIKTQNRNFTTAKANVESNPMQRKIAEFFEHEYSVYSHEDILKTTLLGLATWADSLGYKYYFPYDCFK